MKTLELDLKKKLVIVDINHFNRDGKLQLQEILNNHPDGYELLCNGSELTEEIASELVEEHYMNGIRSYEIYNDYRYNDARWLDNAQEAVISAVESKGFFWIENPYDKSINVNSDIFNSMVRMVNRINYKEQWQEAEEKTFRNPLIFVKK